jgi:hypothetical protein
MNRTARVVSQPTRKVKYLISRKGFPDHLSLRNNRGVVPLARNRPCRLLNPREKLLSFFGNNRGTVLLSRTALVAFSTHEKLQHPSFMGDNKEQSRFRGAALVCSQPMRNSSAIFGSNMGGARNALLPVAFSKRVEGHLMARPVACIFKELFSITYIL